MPYENIQIKIGVDGGGGFLKVCMHIYTPNDPQLIGVMKNTGVKKLLILAICPNVAETYNNLRIVLQKLKLDNPQNLSYPCVFSNNLKVIQSNYKLIEEIPESIRCNF